MTFKIENSEYRIEFRHINRATKFGGLKLRKTSGFKGQTTCVLVFYDPMAPLTKLVIAVETVLCSELDQFSREQGRLHALTLALDRCRKMPRAHIAPLIAAYKRRNEVGLPHPDEVNNAEKNVSTVQSAR